MTSDVLAAVFDGAWGTSASGPNADKRGAVRFLTVGTKGMMREAEAMLGKLGYSVPGEHALLGKSFGGGAGGAVKKVGTAIAAASGVVMAGIAAEAMGNGQAEGGQADESALIQLLGSLDGGKAWDLPRIQNQARWAASQALLLLREHREPYEVLVASLEKGCSVGECIVQLEASLTETFGRNGELPAETRLRVARARLEEEAQRVAAPKPLSASRDSLERELEQVDQKLAEAQRRLEALDSGD